MKLTIPPFRSMHLLHGLLIYGAFWVIWVPISIWLFILPGHRHNPEVVLMQWALWMAGFFIVPFVALYWDVMMTPRIRS